MDRDPRADVPSTDRIDELSALRLSESRLQLAAAALRSYVYDWDLATGAIWRSGAFEEMTGFDAGDPGIDVEFWRSRLHPDDVRMLEEARHAAIDSGQARFNVEYRVRHRDGHYIWVWDHSVAVRDEAGRVARLVGNVAEISARKLAEERLKASERRFKAAVSATADIVWTADPAGAMDPLQEGWAAFTGQQSESWASEGWLTALHPDDVEDARLHWRYAVARGEPFASENRVRRHDGVYRTFVIRATPVLDDSGTVTEWIGVHRDVTDQRGLEANLRDASQRLKLALRAARTGMWSLDYERRVMHWDAECATISGITAREFDRDPDALLLRVRPEHRERLLPITSETRAADGATTVEFEFEFERPDGRARWARVHALFVENTDGRTLRAIGTLHDITDRKTYEAQQQSLLAAERAARTNMESAAKAKDDFLATVSHELRTPLNAMLGWTHLLKRPTVTPAVLAQGLGIIERNGRAQARLIEDLFDANRLMSGKFDFELAPFDPDAVVQLAFNSAAPELARKRLQSSCTLCGAGAVVLGDPRRLQQVATNLLANAGKYSREGGAIEITSDTTVDMWQLRVTDFGEGIDAEVLPHVFDRFFQGESGSARRHGGLGLGLAISKQIVQHLGGRILARSEGIGRGATFEVGIPLFMPAKTGARDGDARPSTQPALPNDALRGLRVLAVDDEPDALEYLARVLREQGAEVIAVDSSTRALRSLGTAAPPFDVMVSDIGLPELSGYDLIRRVRTCGSVEQRSLPAVALTAFARPEDREAALRAGFQRHLAKPFHVTDLVRAVAELARVTH